jgi:hypothetical protein
LFDAIPDQPAEAPAGKVYFSWCGDVCPPGRVAVKEAVQAVVAELLTNPQVVAKLAEAHGLNRQPQVEPTQAPAPQKPSWRERMTARWHAVKSAAARAKCWTVSKLAGGVHKAWSSVTLVGRLGATSRKNAVLAVGVGLTVGAGCYLCGPVVACVVGGVAGAAAAFVARLLRPVWPLVRIAVPGQSSWNPTA